MTDKKTLVAHASRYGSTAEIARAIGDGIRQTGREVDIRPAEQIEDLDLYDSAVICAPIIFGKWKAEATALLRNHQERFQQIPTALFFTCMDLTRVPKEERDDVPIFFDPTLGGPPQSTSKLSAFEKQHLVSAFLDPILMNLPKFNPCSVGFFKGKMDINDLSLALKLLFAVFGFIHKKKTPNGDFRNWHAIASWTHDLAAAFEPQ